MPLPGVGVYAGTKFAVQGFTRGWSRELGPLGITVNNVQPGSIDTELSPADGPNASHFAFLEDPELFNCAVLHFLDDH